MTWAAEPGVPGAAGRAGQAGCEINTYRGLLDSEDSK